MRTTLIAIVVLLTAAQGFAAKPAASADARTAKPKTIMVPNGPTIRDLRDFPIAQLRSNVSPKFYKSLSISPVTAWVVAQVPASPGAEPKIVRSDAGGTFDNFAVELAKDWRLTNYDTVESRAHHPTLNVHLLVYKIADGLMAVNFSHNDQAFYAGHQHTDVWVGVCKDGKWTTIGGTRHSRDLPHPSA